MQPADLADYKAPRDATLAAFPEAFSSDAEEKRGRGAESHLTRLADTRPEGGHVTLAAWDAPGAISC